MGMAYFMEFISESLAMSAGSIESCIMKALENANVMRNVTTLIQPKFLDQLYRLNKL